MAGKVKFDQEAAFKSIIGVEQDKENKTNTQPVTKNKSKDRVQRAYFLDRDIDKALRRMALEQAKVAEYTEEANKYRSLNKGLELDKRSLEKALEDRREQITGLKAQIQKRSLRSCTGSANSTTCRCTSTVRVFPMR